MARRQCAKCGGTGKFCLSILDGRPYSNTGFTCYPCKGTGWVGTKSKKQLKEQLASEEFKQEVIKTAQGFTTPLATYLGEKYPTMKEVIIEIGYPFYLGKEKLYQERYQEEVKAPDSSLIAHYARLQMFQEWEREGWIIREEAKNGN